MRKILAFAALLCAALTLGAADPPTYVGTFPGGGMPPTWKTPTIWTPETTVVQFNMYKADGTTILGNTGHAEWDASPDIEIKDSDGTYIAFHEISQAFPDNDAYHSTTRFRLRPGPVFPSVAVNTIVPVIWYDLDQIPEYSTIIEAVLCLTSMDAEDMTHADQTRGLFAILDVAPGHEGWLDGDKWGDDPRRREATWNDMVYNGGVGAVDWPGWGPGDWGDDGVRDVAAAFPNDVGIKSVPLNDTFDALGDVTIDVTRLVQTYVSGKGLGINNAGFWLLCNAVDSATYMTLGCDKIDQASADYNPFLKVTYTNRAKTLPWRGGVAAFVFSTDDQDSSSNMVYRDTTNAHGVPMTLFTRGDAIREWTYDPADPDSIHDSTGKFSPSEIRDFITSASATYPGLVNEIGHHSYDHTNPNGITANANEAAFDIDMGPWLGGPITGDYLESSYHGFSSVLTSPTTVRAVAYPLGVHNPESMVRLSELGYLGARGAGGHLSAAPSGAGYGSDTADDNNHLSWEGTQSPFCVLNTPSDKITGYDEDDWGEWQIRRYLYRHLMYAINSPNGVVNLFTHDEKTDGSYTGSGIDRDELGWIMDQIVSMPYVMPMTFGDAMAHYRTGHAAAPPPAGSASETAGVTEADAVWFVPTSEAVIAFDLTGNFPIYGNWADYPQKYMATTTYDSIAELDTKIFPHEYMIHDRYIGLVDSVRLRNPDFIPLNYVWAFGARASWSTATEGSLYRNIWDMVDRHSDWWMRTIAGDVVLHSGLSAPNAVVMFNPEGGVDLADSLAAIYVAAIKEKGNLRHHVGFFVDWATTEYPTWAISTTGKDSIDFNQNGTPYSGESSVEEALNLAYIKAFPAALRHAAGDSSFIVVINGNAGYQSELSYLYDGLMYEDFDANYPIGDYQVAEATTEPPVNLSNYRVTPPLIWWQAAEDSVGLTSEVIASMGQGVSNWNKTEYLDGANRHTFTIPPRKITLGPLTPGTITTGDDTTHAMFWDGADSLHVYAVERSTLPWPYLVHRANPTVPADTISRGAAWPRQAYTAPDPPIEQDGQYYTDSNLALSVIINWESDSYEGTVDHFNVYRSETSGSGYVPVGSSPYGQFQNYTVEAGTEYFYVTTAVDAMGHESVYSDEVAVTPILEDLQQQADGFGGALDYMNADEDSLIIRVETGVSKACYQKMVTWFSNRDAQMSWSDVDTSSVDRDAYAWHAAAGSQGGDVITYDTAVPSPVAAQDSTIRLSWTYAGTGNQPAGLIIERRHNWGDWEEICINAAAGVGDTVFYHGGASGDTLEGVRKGVEHYRISGYMTAYPGDAPGDSITAHSYLDSVIYNQAVEVRWVIHADDGTLTSSSGVINQIYTTPEWSETDTTAPVPGIVSVVIDSTYIDSDNTLLILEGSGGQELSIGQFQWRQHYDGVWELFTAPGPDFGRWYSQRLLDLATLDSTYAVTIYDSLNTEVAIADLDSVYVRFRAKDEDQNASEYIYYEAAVRRAGEGWDGTTIISNYTSAVDSVGVDNWIHNATRATAIDMSVLEGTSAAVDWGPVTAPETIPPALPMGSKYAKTTTGNPGGLSFTYGNGLRSYAMFHFGSVDSFAVTEVTSAKLWIKCANYAFDGMEQIHVYSCTGSDVLAEWLDADKDDNTSYMQSDVAGDVDWTQPVTTWVDWMFGEVVSFTPTELGATTNGWVSFDVTTLLQDQIDNDKPILFYMAFNSASGSAYAAFHGNGHQGTAQHEKFYLEVEAE